MGLRDDVQTDVAAAFNEDLSDAVRAFTYIGINSRIYGGGDAGGVVAEVSDAGVTSRGVFFESVEDSEIAAEVVRPVDASLLILQNEIAVSGFDEDGIIDSTFYGKFRILKSMADPASATWTLYLRREHV